MDARFIRASTLKGIADAIRDKKGVQNPLSVSDFATEISSIEGGGDVPPFDGSIEIDGKPATDYTDYYEQGKTEGIAEGREAEWNDFWDAFQQNGTRTAYPYAYAYANDEVFKPKYNLICSGYYGAQGMFAYSTITDVVKILNDRDISIETSETQIFTEFLRRSKTISSPPLDLTSATNISLAFYDASNLRNVTLLNIPSDLKFDRTFGYSPKIENVVITGIIGQNIDFQYTTYLSKASITNIIEHLSTTSSGKTLTLSKKAVNTAFETSEGAADGSTSEEWTALIATRSNWTISLV